MDGKLETIIQRGIERNASDETSKSGAMQELFNLRFKDGAWRNANRKKLLGSAESQEQELIGWFSHPSTNRTSFIAFEEQTRRIRITDYQSNTFVYVKKRNESFFYLPLGEEFVNFGHLENVLVLFSTEQMHRFLWLDGAFEYVEFGDIEWTCEKTNMYAQNITGATTKLVIGMYQQIRKGRVKLGYIEGITSFRLAIEMADGEFIWYSDIKTLRATSVYDFINLDPDPSSPIANPSETSPGFSQSTAYRPIIAYNNYALAPMMRATLSQYTDYKPKIQFALPEWIKYYIEKGVIHAIHVCATKPRYPYIPEIESWTKRTTINNFDYYHISDSVFTSYPKVPYLDEIDVFYSIFKTTIGQLRAPFNDEGFDFSDFETKKEIPTDNFTGTKITSKYNFNYNQRIHLEQITNTLPSPKQLDNLFFKDISLTSGHKVRGFLTFQPPLSVRNIGDKWVVNWDAPTDSSWGAWAGQAGKIATWVGYGIGTDGWVFYNAPVGERIYVIDNSGYNEILPFAPRNSYYCGVFRRNQILMWEWIGLASGHSTYLAETPLIDYVPTSGYSMYTEVVLTIDNKTYVVRKKVDKTYKLVKEKNNEVYCGRDFLYPNVSATEVRFSFSKDGVNFYKLKSPQTRLPLLSISSLNTAQAYKQIDDNTNFAVANYSDINDFDYFGIGYEYAHLLYLKLSVPVSGTDYSTHLGCTKVTEGNGRYVDTNRIQLSELSNPFLFPAKNSYRFGDINNEVVGVEVPREQLSETRFGQFPLYVFTTQGIWVMEQGSADITYANSYYLDKYICDSNDLIRSVQGFVCFSTKEGLYAVSGKSFKEISTQLEGRSETRLIGQEKLNTILSHFSDRTTEFIYLSDQELKDEIQYMIMCHDHINKEIIYSPSRKQYAAGQKKKNYSYVYDTVTTMWHKISEKFEYFIDTSPNVVGVKHSTEARINEKEPDRPILFHVYSFYDIHEEDGAKDVRMGITKPITFGTMMYKRIEQLLARFFAENKGSKLELSPYMIYVFGSIDGKEYKLLQGGELEAVYINDVSIRRVFVDCKYFIFAYASKHQFVEVMAFETVVKPKFTKTMR